MYGGERYALVINFPGSTTMLQNSVFQKKNK
jgi:hypothetical protein